LRSFAAILRQHFLAGLIGPRRQHFLVLRQNPRKYFAGFYLESVLMEHKGAAISARGLAHSKPAGGKLPPLRVMLI